MTRNAMARWSLAPLALLSALASTAAAAEAGPMLLEGVFQDRAVFQRDRPIPIWGRAEPGEDVTVDFAGRTVRAKADRTGRWRAELAAMPAGGPYVLTAATRRGGRQVLNDILVGDVWLCSGQSNMEYGVRNGLNGWNEVNQANDPNIRLLSVGHDVALAPLEQFQTPVRWEAANSQSVADFSAACWFMAKDLKSRTNVPFGLIDASWGGSAIDAWRSEASLSKDPAPRERLEVLRAYRTDLGEGNRRWGKLWEAWWREKSGDAPGAEPWQAGAAGEWKPVPRLANFESWGDPALVGFNGLIWYRNTITLTPEQARQGATLSLGGADDVDISWVNGVTVGSNSGPGTPRSYPIPAGTLKAGANTVAVSVLDTYSNGGLIGDPALYAIRFADGSSVPLATGWSYRAVPASVGWPPRAPWESLSGLSTIYNGMIAPLGNYAVKGTAWYQGETDAGTTRGYAGRLGALMADWRRQFATPRMPFLVVQLANWGAPNATPQESGFATIRDEQRLAVLADPNAGLAVTIDIGEPTDIHPANKQDVGRRLARAARKVAYGEALTPSGPEGDVARRTSQGIEVRFRNVEGGLLAYSAAQPIGFEVCGPDQASCRFAPARNMGQGVILDPGPGAATRVRYCWGDAPVCNLYDDSGLPAGPFEIAIRP